MALQCNVSLNYASYTAGQTPPPMATLQVYNPGAVPVNVQSVQMQFYDVSGTISTMSAGASVPPIGPGMTTLVPSLSSITIGPFPVVVASASNVNSFAAVNQAGNLFPINPQRAERSHFTLMVGALVYGSDLSVNVAGQAALLVSYTSNPPPGFQGGYMNFAGPNNLAVLLLTGGI